MLKSRETYEIMTPESIGLNRAADDAGIVLGKHSGRNALSTRLKQLGCDLQQARAAAPRSALRVWEGGGGGALWGGERRGLSAERPSPLPR